MRRCPLPPAVTLAAALTLAGWSAPAGADTIANYTLTTSTGLPDPGTDIQHSSLTGPQVIANIVPPGGVVAPTLTNPDGTPQKNADGTPKEGPPLSLLSGSTGFDQNSMVVSLTPTDSSGQLLGLTFFNGGLAKGGQVHFALDINSALKSPPQLQVITPGTGVSITADPAAPAGGTTSPSTPPTTSTPNIPEPLSLLLWSTAAGVGMLRARRRGSPARA